MAKKISGEQQVMGENKKSSLWDEIDNKVKRLPQESKSSLWDEIESNAKTSPQGGDGSFWDELDTSIIPTLKPWYEPGEGPVKLIPPPQPISPVSNDIKVPVKEEIKQQDENNKVIDDVVGEILKDVKFVPKPGKPLEPEPIFETTQNAARFTLGLNKYIREKAPEINANITIQDVQDDPKRYIDLLFQINELSKYKPTTAGQFARELGNTAFDIGTFGLINPAESHYENLRQEYGDIGAKVLSAKEYTQLGTGGRLAANLLGGVLGFAIPAKLISGAFAATSGALEGVPLIAKYANSFKNIVEGLEAGKYAPVVKQTKNIAKLGSEGSVYGTISGGIEAVKGDKPIKEIPKKAVEEAENFILFGYLFKAIFGGGRYLGKSIERGVVKKGIRSFYEGIIDDSIELTPREKQAMKAKLRRTRKSDLGKIHQQIIKLTKNKKKLNEVKKWADDVLKEEGQSEKTKPAKEPVKETRKTEKSKQQTKKTAGGKDTESPAKREQNKQPDTEKEIKEPTKDNDTIKKKVKAKKKIKIKFKRKKAISDKDVVEGLADAGKKDIASEVTGEQTWENLVRYLREIGVKLEGKELKKIARVVKTILKESHTSDRDKFKRITDFLRAKYPGLVPEEIALFDPYTQSWGMRAKLERYNFGKKIIKLREKITKKRTPKIVLYALRKTQNELEKTMLEGMNVTKEFDKVFNEFIHRRKLSDKETQELINRIHAAITGERVALPTEFRDVIKRTREIVDDLSKQIQYLLPGDSKLQGIIEENKGRYITRIYWKWLRPEIWEAPAEKKEALRIALGGELNKGLFHELSAPKASKGLKNAMDKANIATLDDIVKLSEAEFVDIIKTHAAKNTQNVEYFASSTYREAVELSKNSEEILDAMILGIEKTGRFGESALTGNGESVLLNNSILMKRGIFSDIPKLDKLIRDVMGEVKDPTLNLLTTIQKQSSWIAKRRMQHFIRDNVLALESGDARKFLYQGKPYKEYNIKLVGKKWGALEGLYTSAEVKNGMEGLFNPAFVDFGNVGLNHLYRFVLASNTTLKKFFTVYSPVTHVRNFYANVTVAWSNGHALTPEYFDLFQNNLRVLMKYVQFKNNHKKLAPEEISLIKEWMDNNVMGHGFRGAEIKKMVGDYKQDSFEIKEQFRKRHPLHPLSIKKFMEKLSHYADDIYEATDDLFKITAYMYDTRVLGLPRKYVSDQVWGSYPNYSDLPQSIKNLRVIPVVGTYPSFPTAITKSTFYTGKAFVDDLKNGYYKKAFMRMTGAGLAGAAHYQGASFLKKYAPWALEKLGIYNSRQPAKFNIDRKKEQRGLVNDPVAEKALDELVAAYDKHQNIVWAYNGNGEFSGLVYNYLLPYKNSLPFAAADAIAIAAKTDGNEGWQYFENTFLDPFTGKSLLYGAVEKAKDAYDATPSSMDMLDRMSHALDKSWLSISPGFVREFYGPIKRAERYKYIDRKSTSEAVRQAWVEELLKVGTGTRVIHVNIFDKLEWKFRYINKELNKIDIYSSKELRKSKSPEAIKKTLLERVDYYSRELNKMINTIKLVEDGLKVDLTDLTLVAENSNTSSDVTSVALTKDKEVVKAYLMKTLRSAKKKVIDQYTKAKSDIRDEQAFYDFISKNKYFDSFLDEADRIVDRNIDVK